MLSSVNECALKFLKFEVYEKSASLIPIFKSSWNESPSGSQVFLN